MATSAPLAAQVSAAADVGGMVHRTGVSFWRSATRASPLVRIDGRWTQMRGDAEIWGGADGLYLQHGAVDLLAAPAPLGPFRLTTAAHVERVSLAPQLQRTGGSVESALSLRLASGGGWFGLAAERAGSTDFGMRPLLRGGLWQRFGMMTLTLSAESHHARLGARSPSFKYDTIPGYTTTDSLTGESKYIGQRLIQTGDSGAMARARFWSDVQGRISWTAGRASVDARFGVQSKVDMVPRSLWVRSAGTIAVAPRLSLVASAGVQPASLWLGTPSSRFVSLGLRFAPASLIQPPAPPFVRPTAAGFVIHRADGDTTGIAYTVIVRVLDARAVELSGDFNGWRPIALREMRPAVWEGTLSLAAGTHRISMRVNGDRWVAPPGLATADDDFNGTVGLIVVP